MENYRIALLPGDGIGVEVMEAAQSILEVLKLDAEYVMGDIGWEFWRNEGNPLPDRTVKTLKSCTCALFGAITSKPKEEALEELGADFKDQGLSYFSPIVRLRQLFDLYVNLRPCRSYPGNPLNYKDDIDIVVFRENTEGLYCGVEFFPFENELRQLMERLNPAMARFQEHPNDEIAVTLRMITKSGARRIIQKAFEYADKFGYPKVTLAEKPNMLRETSGLMCRQGREVAKTFPHIQLEITNIDAQMMWLVKNPEAYGVIVTSNLFGDILSDLTAQLVGGLGFACSGNIGDQFAVFEPTHGSAPKYEGKNLANPVAMLLAVRMMLDWLGETESAERLETSVKAVLAEGKVRTRDMGGTSSTSQMAHAVLERL